MALYGLKLTRPFIGNIYHAAEDRLFGFTGLTDFDGNPLQELMTFSLDNDASFKYWFSADYNAAFDAGVAIGYAIKIDGTYIARWATSDTPAAGISPPAGEMFVPSKAVIVLELANPDINNGAQVAAGMYLSGFKLPRTSAGREVGEVTRPPLLPASVLPATPASNTKNYATYDPRLEGW